MLYTTRKEVGKLEDLKQVISSAIVGVVATEITKRLLDALIKRVDRQKKTSKGGQHFKRS